MFAFYVNIFGFCLCVCICCVRVCVLRLHGIYLSLFLWIYLINLTNIMYGWDFEVVRASLNLIAQVARSYM